MRDLQTNNHAHSSLSLSSFLQSPLLDFGYNYGDSNSISHDYLSHESIQHRGAPYILSPICGGCFRSKIGKKYCVDLIETEMRNIEKKQPPGSTNSTLLEAARIVAKGHGHCEICDPDTCWEHHTTGKGTQHSLPDDNNAKENKVKKQQYKTKYWRFDQSNPKFTSPTTLTLGSIPTKYRIPPSRFQDIRAFFIEKFNETVRTKSLNGMDFLLEYNPGLVVIPPKIKQFLPKEAVYLVSLRVTPANNCFPTEVYANLPKDVWSAVYLTTINHLGLALLDENYRMLPGYDVVIELDMQLDLKRNLRPGEAVSVTFMDYRLFVLNNEIHLHVNADTVIVAKLELKAKGFGSDENESTANGASPPFESKEDRMDRPYKLKNLFGGDLLQVTLSHQFNTLWSGGIYGKNYALFSVPNATHPGEPDSIYAEIDITPHHKVQQILPDEHDKITLQRVFEYIWKPNTRKSRHFKIDTVNMRSMKTIGNTTQSDTIAPLPSFSTVDEHWFPGRDVPFKESAHGGACCVSFSFDDINIGGTQNNHHESLLVGIAHTKVNWKPWYSKAHIPQEKKDAVPHTHYVSFFYAFDPRPPFQLRARSGYFCLGFADSIDSGEGGTFNQHSILTHNRPLRQVSWFWIVIVLNIFKHNCIIYSFLFALSYKKKFDLIILFLMHSIFIITINLPCLQTTTTAQ